MIEIALWLGVALLIGILVVLVTHKDNPSITNVIPSYIALHDPLTAEAARVSDGRLITRSSATPIASFKSDEGVLIAFAAGLLDIPANFNASVLFFRNDNHHGLNFYLDYISYAWHPLDGSKSLTIVTVSYDCTEPNNHVVEPVPISMNQNYPNAAKDNDVFVRAWDNVGPLGMEGSTGGRTTTIFTLEDEYRTLPYDGRIIIGHNGTQRFDIKTDRAGVLRLAVVGWFADSI